MFARVMNLVTHPVADGWMIRNKYMKYEVDTLRNIEVRIKNKILKENSKLKWEKINLLKL